MTRIKTGRKFERNAKRSSDGSVADGPSSAERNSDSRRDSLKNDEGQDQSDKDNTNLMDERGSGSSENDGGQGQTEKDNKKRKSKSKVKNGDQIKRRPIRESKPQTPEPAPKGEGKKNIFKEMLVIAVIIVVAVLYVTENKEHRQDFCDPHQSRNCSAFLSQEIQILSKKYGNQSARLWAVLRSAATSHAKYNPNPERPIVIMVYNCHDRPIQQETIYTDIARAYEAVLSPNRERGPLEINAEEFASKDSDFTQARILKAFQEGYDIGGKRVAVVHNFDLLPSCSVLAFHNLCNNDDAPYKDMAIILTVAGKEENAEIEKSTDLEKIISEKFQEKWKDCPEYLPRDKIDAILSRVANNVVTLK